MKKCRSILNVSLIAMFALQVAINASAQNPVFDITNPAFAGGAKCDGVHDDQPAIQAAANAANATTGTRGFSTATVFTPPGKTGCLFKEPLNFDNFQNVRFISGGQTYPGSLGGSAQWLYTGTASPAISMRSVTGITTDGVYWGFNNSSFTGTFIEMTHSSAGNDSAYNRFSNSFFAGAGVNSAGIMLSLDKAIITLLDNTVIAGGKVEIRGASGSGSYSNVITLVNCSFPTTPGTAYIQNPGANWTILSNTFELGAGAPVIQFVNNFTAWGGMVFANNFVADATGSATYTMFSFPAQSQFNGSGGLSFTGNFIGGSSTNQTEFSFGDYTKGIVIEGNDFFTTVGTLVAVGANVGITIGSNSYSQIGSISTFLSGTPATGSVLDNTGTTTVYGQGAFNSSLTVNGNGVGANSAMTINGPGGINATALTVNNGLSVINGDLWVNGTVSKQGGSFRIDHPLDPEHKYLLHSFVESPDMKNVYDGVAILDSKGRAEITLPAYFEALNKDFRYQLTCIGRSSPIYIAEEIHANRFVIAGGKPGQKISWQVTGIRHDSYANEHRIIVEQDKPVLKESK